MTFTIIAAVLFFLSGWVFSIDEGVESLSVGFILLVFAILTFTAGTDGLKNYYARESGEQFHKTERHVGAVLPDGSLPQVGYECHP